MTDADVIIVGAGPTGLMLACELCLAGVRPLVLEREPQPQDAPKANGRGGRILQLLRYRGPTGTIQSSQRRPQPGSPIPVRRCASGLHTPGRSPAGHPYPDTLAERADNRIAATSG